jgi:hypothetical protein
MGKTMKDLIISSIPLQKLILEACQNLKIELYIKLPMAIDSHHSIEMKRKIMELELLMPTLSEIIKNNSDA